MVEVHAFPKRVGNSWAVIIPKEKADMLNLTADTELHLEIDAVQKVENLVGTFKSKRSTLAILKEIDRGWKE